MSNYSDSKFYQQENPTSWDATFDLVPPKSIVLDVGCSVGTFGAELISKKQCVVDGIEIDASDIKDAKTKLRTVYEFNIETDQLDIKERYDVIFMGDVIEHLARPAAALDKIKKLLKKDGILIFSMPNITHMSVRLMLLKGEIEYGKTGLLDETHLHFYNEQEVRRVFCDAGLNVSKMIYIPKKITNEALEREFNEIGLKIEDKFKDIENSYGASTYQFVGVAKVGKCTDAKVDLKQKSPEDVNEKYVREWRAGHELKYKELEQKYNELSAELLHAKKGISGRIIKRLKK